MYISASAPDAPPFSDTTIGCFMRLFFWIAACIIRAIWSEAPPAPAATTISTGLVGSQAKAGTLDTAIASQTAAPSTTLRMYFFPLVSGRALTPGVLVHPDKKALSARVIRFSNRRSVLFLCDRRVLARHPQLTANHFEMSGSIGLRSRFEIRHRRFDTAGPMRHARGGKTHLHTGQGSHQSELVAFAEVADAKHFAREFGEAGAERHVVSFKHGLGELVGVVSRRHQHGGQHRRKFRRFKTQHLEAPLRDGGARGGREALMPGEYRIQPFLEQHRDGFAQAVEQVGGRRDRKSVV